MTLEPTVGAIDPISAIEVLMHVNAIQQTTVRGSWVLVAVFSHRNTLGIDGWHNEGQYEGCSQYIQISPAVPPFSRPIPETDRTLSQVPIKIMVKPNIDTKRKFLCNSYLEYRGQPITHT